MPASIEKYRFFHILTSLDPGSGKDFMIRNDELAFNRHNVMDLGDFRRDTRKHSFPPLRAIGCAKLKNFYMLIYLYKQTTRLLVYLKTIGRNRMRSTFTAALAAAVVGLGAQAQAEYPEKPVKIIIPFGVGGSTTAIVRSLAEYLEPALGEDVVITNVNGAGGSVGLIQAMKAKPDGYTIGMYADNLPVAMALGQSLATDRRLRARLHDCQACAGPCRARRWRRS
ncbi:tripartite tricarboxylate transporter substrate-binding protein [Phaeobacter sp. J2-8]|uniref:tripartite tricarboxylate transporter substrate-binding protein n=1 Tax=Phaeobacter sp. J2-8 TaxID=2931394 RepID=UPI00245512FA|nr:tripartite tricarboxylate transporter substrate-binding protein [Phaeobacter sp. J2-8]